MKRGKPLKARPNLLPTDLRKAVFARDGEQCAMCGGRMRWDELEVHHRKLKSRGGDDSLDNLISLHRFGCHQSVHLNTTWATSRGFMCPSWEVPSSWPVLRHAAYWEQPTADGWLPAVPMEGQNEDGDPGMPPRAAWLTKKRSS